MLQLDEQQRDSEEEPEETTSERPVEPRLTAASAAPTAKQTASAKKTPEPAPPLEPLPNSAEDRTIDIFKRASPSVVYITNLSVRSDPFRRNVFTIPRGSGSGFFWDDRGHVVTNYHVVKGADAARVTLSDRSVHQAKLVGVAPDKDLAVLRIEAPKDKLEPLSIGTSGGLVVGQTVLAIGNPFGLDQTLSRGVISGLGREIRSLSGRPIQGVVQTDAAINPGNSGGPLLDSNGKLIGVNTAIYSPSGAFAGIGFAVPVDTVSRIVPQLIQHGRVIKPGLGIHIAESSIAHRFGVQGVLILGVIEESAAAEAGLRPMRRDAVTGAFILGDVIVALDGQKVAEPDDLFRFLDTRQVGDAVKVTVQRGDQNKEITLKLTPLPEPEPR